MGLVITAFLSYFLERCEEKGGIDDGSLRVDSMGKKKIKNKTKKQGGDIFHSRAHISFSFIAIRSCRGICAAKETIDISRQMVMDDLGRRRLPFIQDNLF